ncbi:MAG: hypothetical protein QM740_20090 [Acidovorax sp.]
MKIHVSLACWPGLSHEAAAQMLREPVDEPLFGQLSVEHVQVVPQCVGCLTEERADVLRAACPGTQLRLHANVHLLPERRLADLSGFDAHADWFAQAARVSQRLNAPAYTAHAGRRSQAGLSAMLDHARRCADLFGCPVGVEGHYPSREDIWLVSSWQEYRAVFESGVPYALDLSHLYILATRSGRLEMSLVAEMLACERCIEVHVSANDGSGDWHQVCTEPPWWHPLLGHVHPHAMVFSEGNHRRTRGDHVH